MTEPLKKALEELKIQGTLRRGEAVLGMLRSIEHNGITAMGNYQVGDEFGFELYMSLRRLYETDRQDLERRRTEEGIIYGKAQGRL
jgi:hypothetical protein